MQKLLIICGPTATGKTKLAVELAKQYNGELISADSRQVYIGMNIATGKDLPNDSIGQRSKVKWNSTYLSIFDIGGVPIWLYDVVYPNESFTVSHYQKLVHLVIADIHRRGKLPIVVGGTGLYIQAIVAPKDYYATIPDETLRKSLAGVSTPALQKKLQMLNNEVYTQMNYSDQNNPRRLIRKIEIYSERGTQTFQKKIDHFVSYNSFCIGLASDTKTLYQAIDARVDERVSQGVENEIRQLLAKGYTWDLPAFSAMGYRQWQDYFEHTKDKNAVIQQWKYAEHAYARKQGTWFRKQPYVRWYTIKERATHASLVHAVRDWFGTDI